MTNAELIRRIVKLGRAFHSNGKKHDVYINPVTGGKARILRHWTQQIDADTLSKIKKDLGMPNL